MRGNRELPAIGILKHVRVCVIKRRASNCAAYSTCAQVRAACAAIGGSGRTLSAVPAALISYYSKNGFACLIVRIVKNQIYVHRFIRVTIIGYIQIRRNALTLGIASYVVVGPVVRHLIPRLVLVVNSLFTPYLRHHQAIGRQRHGNQHGNAEQRKYYPFHIHFPDQD